MHVLGWQRNCCGQDGAGKIAYRNRFSRLTLHKSHGFCALPCLSVGFTAYTAPFRLDIMTQINHSSKELDYRGEMDRVWAAIDTLTATVQAEVISTAELKAQMRDLITKVTEVVTGGTSRCADHNARLDRAEYNIELIDSGKHPACRACSQGMKNWVYASLIAALMAIGTTAVGIIF